MIPCPTTERRNELTICPKCKELNYVGVIQFLDDDGTEDYINIDGYQECSKCKYVFEEVDIKD